MKTLRERIAWLGPVVVYTLLLLPALLPLLRGTGLPCTHDNDLHAYRMVAMRSALRHGWLFARWVPNLALGYGYPFFNFREPVPYLFGDMLYAVGVPLPVVLGSIYAASMVAAAWGAHILARELFGPRAAWVAGAAYGLGPYLLLDALRRGNMPESVALALLPWLLLTFRRLILTGRRGSFVASTLLLAGLFLSHNISSLLLAPFLGGYVVLLSWMHRERRAWPWAFAAVALAVSMTVWFVGPALLEQDTVQLHLSRTTRNNDFHYNFVSWAELLLTPPAPYDPDFLNPPMRVPLGIPQAALAVAGLALGLRRARDAERRALLVFFAGAAFAYLWMSTPASVRIWEAVPLLAFVQFPWRLVGRALLPAALLGAAAFAGPARGALPLKDRLRYHVPALVAVALVTLFAWPESYPPKGFCPMAPYPGMEAVYAFEQAGWMGVDPEGSYFPVWVEEYPGDTALAEHFAAGEEPARLDPAALPEGARVVEARYAPLRARLTVESPAPFRARWLGLYYPGWRVRVDGEAVPAAPEEGSGLLTFELPAGRREVVVAFGPTPFRAGVTLVSLLALAAFAGLALLWRRVAPAPEAPAGGVQPPWLWPYAAAAILLAALHIPVAASGATPVLRPRVTDAALPEVERALRQPYAGGLTLLGYDLGAEALRADDELAVDLLWQARERPARDYRTAVLLIGPDGRPWSPPGGARPRGHEPTPPTSAWQPGQYAYDPHVVAPLPGTPPGSYRVLVSLFDAETLTPASLLGPDGNPTVPELTLGTVEIGRPAAPPSRAALRVPEGAALRRCGSLGLLHAAADRAQAAPGELVALRWVWEAAEAPGAPLSATLTLRDGSGAVAQRWSLPPSAAWWPTDRWEAGDRWIGQPLVRLPGGLEGGRYTLETALPGCDPLAAVALEVVAPERAWELPAGLTPAGVTFTGAAGDAIRLAGYVLEPAQPAPGETLRVQLAWQALGEIERSYRVYLHLVGPGGQLVAQSDGEPAGWTRPTTGWAEGEVVLDERLLDLPADWAPGDYTLRVGLYLPGGPRLESADGDDGATLAILSP